MGQPITIMNQEQLAALLEDIHAGMQPPHWQECVDCGGRVTSLDIEGCCDVCWQERDE